MGFREELSLLLRACYPILYIPTEEEERAEQALSTCASGLGNRMVYLWDFVEGYQGNPNDRGFAQRNPLQALEFLDKVNTPAVFVLRDFHRFLDDVAIARKLRNLSRSLKSKPQNIVILAPELNLPSGLTEVVHVVDFPLPDYHEIETEVEQLLKTTSASLTAQATNELVRACQGLSMERIRRVLARAIATHSQLSPQDVDLILEEKRQSIRQTQILDFFPAEENMSDIGGLDNLKDWLLRRGGAFSEQARQYGLPHPKGLLLVGIQGTGKSLTAKAIAHHWHLPLLRLDVGRLFAVNDFPVP